MVIVENYPKAYKEVFVILNNMRKEEQNLIPESFMQTIKTNMDENYNFKLEEDVDFENQKLMRETRTILAYIFVNYWASKEQKRKIEKKFKQDIIDWENNKPAYNQEELFESRKAKISKKENVQNIEQTDNEISKENQLTIVKKQTIFTRIIDKLKTFFKR